MDLDLDKEIDAMLRQMGRTGPNGKTAVNVSTTHLDADDISAFADNALPPRTRSAYMVHLADCGDCRLILKNTIEMNAESGPEPEIVDAPAAKTSTIPWYRRLSLFPNLAYAMGGLVIIFAGFIGYSLLLNGGASMELSRSSEDYPGTYEASNSNVNAATSANAATASVDTAANEMAGIPTANSAANIAATTPNRPAMNANSPEIAARSAEPMSAPAEFDSSINAADKAPMPAAAPPPAKPVTEDVVITVPKPDDEPKLGAVTRGAPERADAEKQTGIAANEVRTKQARSAETRTVGGKRFERKQRVWYDSAYSGQATSNIKRGSDAYRRLDRGIRSIAESLNGTVVVVWSGKAYRIQ